MLVVAIESATDAAGVAVADESGTIAVMSVSRGRRHAETITPAIRWCCESAGIEPKDLDAVAVDIGPGLFTGLRVGIATAKGLAYALRCPIMAVDSLQVLATAADTNPSRSHRVERIVPVIDARRGEVVSAEFSLSATDNSHRQPEPSTRLTRESDDLLETPEDLAARLAAVVPYGPEAQGPAAPVLLVGDGALRYSKTLSGIPGARIGPRWLASPPVNVLAEIGVRRAADGDFEDPAEVLPRYVRQADTRINWSTRAPRTQPAT